MIIADSSVWIGHLRSANAQLSALLEMGEIATHDFVIGELALGSLRKRDFILQALQDLPQATHADEKEVLHFIATHNLYNSGIGYVDAHLLASARLSSALLWTGDKRLHAAATRLELAY